MKQAPEIHPLLYTNLVQQFLVSLNPLTLISGNFKNSWQAVEGYANNQKALKKQFQQESEKLARIQQAMLTISGTSEQGSRINRLR